MSKRIVVDPITRIEGHLRVDVGVDGGTVTTSWSSGQMFRGIELILEGRDPREAWLFAQRICGVCTTVHAITSVRAKAPQKLTSSDLTLGLASTISSAGIALV